MSKRKILLISDDINVPTGVSIMSKNIMQSTSDTFDWVQYGGLQNHPNNQRVSMHGEIKVYGAEKFGNGQMLNEVIKIEKPDAIMFFTDPRFFIHLFQEEYDIRQNIPWMYYTIWDNEPAPHFNKPYYESCDGVFCISKLTEKLVNEVLNEPDKDLAENRVVKYVPHGLDENVFKPMSRKNKKFRNKINSILDFDPFDHQFIVLWSNKNMDRKKPHDIMTAFDNFMTDNELYFGDALLIMNTNPVGKHGGDLYQFKYDNIKNQNNIRFINNGSFKDEEMPYIYNLADIVVNNSDNEGWGLALTEAKLCSVPIMATNTGGMKDQILDDEGKYGDWVFPLEVDTINFMGNPVSSYIHESRVNISKIQEQLEDAFFNHTYDDLKALGLKGREHAIMKGHTNEIMCQRMTEAINDTIDSFEPRQKLKIKKF